MIFRKKLGGPLTGGGGGGGAHFNGRYLLTDHKKTPLRFPNAVSLGIMF